MPNEKWRNGMTEGFEHCVKSQSSQIQGQEGRTLVPWDESRDGVALPAGVSSHLDEGAFEEWNQFKGRGKSRFRWEFEGKYSTSLPKDLQDRKVRQYWAEKKIAESEAEAMRLARGPWPVENLFAPCLGATILA